MDIALAIAGVAVFAWLLIIVYRQDARKQLPWFVRYVVWELAVSCIELVLLSLNRRWYLAIYWWLELVEVALIVAAVRESFLQIFYGFTRKPWFRLSLWAVIVAVVINSALKAFYFPPAQGNWLTAFVLGAEFAFRSGIVAIALLTVILIPMVKEPLTTREFIVILGFVIASVPILGNVALVSVFGTKYIFFSRYLASAGYFLVAFLWIWAFPLLPGDEGGFEERGIGPEDIIETFRRYWAFIARMRKQW